MGKPRNKCSPPSSISKDVLFELFVYLPDNDMKNMLMASNMIQKTSKLIIDDQDLYLRKLELNYVIKDKSLTKDWKKYYDILTKNPGKYEKS
jgi:hypothetical protein